MRPLRCLIPFLLALLPALPAAAGEIAGRVELVEGWVSVEGKAGHRRAPAVGDAIEEGSLLVTGADGELHLRMADEGYLALRPNTRLRIEAYRARGGADDRSVLGLLQGALRSVTGWIGRYNRPNYSVRTPTATIGVRGTGHEPAYFATEAPAGAAPGTYDKVNSGAVAIETAAGSVMLEAGQAGFASPVAGRPPQRLDRPPAFYGPTRNESRIDSFGGRQDKQLDEKHRQKRLEQDRQGRQGRSGERALAPDRVEGAEAPEKTRTPDRPEAMGAPAPLERLDPRPGTMARPETPDRPQAPPRPDRVDRPEPPARPERPEPPVRPDRIDRIERPTR